ncbi:MAG: hypothetical protein LBC85_04470 [Fibromonadaceae bacterium]|jgi:outer membrane murein-binding lipoprotein Lpp|nr:hypothetical protein [Fibromonadaceae bacterium]
MKKILLTATILAAIIITGCKTEKEHDSSSCTKEDHDHPVPEQESFKVP